LGIGDGVISIGNSVVDIAIDVGGSYEAMYDLSAHNYYE
jgi:hypothetical protein